jgi:hypothetical protein
MSPKARLADLAKQMESMPQGTGQAAGRLEELARPESAPKSGASSRLTVTLPPDLQQALSLEVERRVNSGLAGASASAVVREALTVFFSK